jgi:acetyl esterase
MPLDPQTRELLDQLARANVSPFERLSPAEAREQMLAASALLGPHPQPASIADVEIPGSQGAIPARVYAGISAERADQTGRAAPLVVFYHGGGWVVGSVETHDGYCRALAVASGAVVVSVDYRLAPEHRFPAAWIDAYDAACWAYEQSEQLGADRNRLVVAGDSAGGNLAAVVCLAARDRKGPPIAKQILIYPICDADFETASYREMGEGYFLTRDTMQWFFDHYAPQASDRASPFISPLRAADLTGLPPAFVLTAEYDPLRDEGEAYAKRLIAAGVPTTLARYPGMIHGFMRRTKLLPQAREALALVAAEVRGV